VVEREADASEFDRPKFNRQEIIVTGRPPIMQVTFDHWKNDPLMLQFAEVFAQMPDEFPTGRLEDVEITRIIYMVAYGAVGVSDPVLAAES
jgi:hypothetical protein